jgi:hypothetical protein
VCVSVCVSECACACVYAIEWDVAMGSRERMNSNIIPGGGERGWQEKKKKI